MPNGSGPGRRSPTASATIASAGIERDAGYGGVVARDLDDERHDGNDHERTCRRAQDMREPRPWPALHTPTQAWDRNRGVIHRSPP